MCAQCPLTLFTGVINEYDLLEKWPRGSVDSTPYCTNQCRPGFIVEYYHHTRRGQQGRVGLVSASGDKNMALQHDTYEGHRTF